MSEHARLAPSSAHRWVSCPASVRMAEELGTEVDNRFTREGTLAHTRAELELLHSYGQLTDKAYANGVAKWAAACDASGDGEDGFDRDDMELHAKSYVEAIQELCSTLEDPTVRVEARVRPGVPDCWGTSDAIILSKGRIDVWDYKYGSGLMVFPADNPQLKLYGLGALEEYALLQDVDDVVLHIYQPRVGNKAWRSWPCLPADLYDWRDEVVIPVAKLAKGYDAPFGPSAEACRYCPASGQCRAQLEQVVAIEFEDDVDLLSPAELATALALVPAVKVWADAVEARALALAYENGTAIPGYKVVRSGGRRYIVDQEAAAKLLERLGFKDYLKPKVLATLGVLGKLQNEAGDVALPTLEEAGLVKKSEGKLSLGKASDDRPAITAATSAAEDFA